MCYPKTEGCYDPYAVNCYLATWEDLGRIWEGSGKDLGRSGKIWEDLGRIWEGSGKDLGRMGRILGEFQLFVLVSRKHLLPGTVMKFMKLRILPVLPQHFTA